MLEPISQDRPAGSDISYDPDFERLEGEIRKMESLSGETVDWSEVVSLGTSLLTEKAKDFRVAAYLAVGLLHEKGYPGLTEGLTLFGRLIESFWKSGFPALKRLRARLSVLEWFSEKLTQAVEQTRPDDPAAVQPGLEALEFLNAQVRETLGDKAPSLAGLEKALNHWASAPAEAAEGPPQEPETPAARPVERPVEARPKKTTPDKTAGAPRLEPVRAVEPAPQPARPSPEPASIEEQQAAQKELQKIQASLKRLASFYRKNDPQNPEAYRLSRVAAWLAVDSAPPHANNKTRVPAPPQDTQARLEDLLARREWEVLLEGAESRFGETIFWLDAQRYVFEAMSGLGTAFEACKRVVTAETSALIRRVPDLPELKFDNNMPMANAQTRAWIETRVLSAAKIIPSDVTAAASEDRSAHQMAEALDEAKTLAAQGHLREAVSLMQRSWDRAPTARSRFLSQLQTARFFQDLDRPDLAWTQLDALRTTIRRHGLEEWEPALCTEVYRDLLLAAKRRLRSVPEPTPADRQALEEALARLYRLDAIAALDIRDEK